MIFQIYIKTKPLSHLLRRERESGSKKFGKEVNSK